MMALTTDLKALYEIDDYQWLEKTIELLIYQAALKYVRHKTGFKVNFPQECTDDFEQLLALDWLP